MRLAVENCEQDTSVTANPTELTIMVLRVDEYRPRGLTFIGFSDSTRITPTSATIHGISAFGVN